MLKKTQITFTSTLSGQDFWFHENNYLLHQHVKCYRIYVPLDVPKNITDLSQTNRGSQIPLVKSFKISE